MKKLWITTLLIMLPIFLIGYSQEIFYGPNPTVEWNEVYVPGASSVRYELGVRDTVTQEVFVVGETYEFQYTYDISGYDNILDAGVRTKAIIFGETKYSVWNWSNEPEGVPFPFVLKASSPDVLAPDNFRVIQ